MAECHVTHGLSRKGRKHPLYLCWESIKSRCYIQSSSAWKDYGARGIRMCAEWLTDPAAFVAWAISAGWHQGLEIDRRDNDGNYTPENCRVVTRTRNMRNTRLTRMLTAFGETKSLPDWVDDPRCSVRASTIRTRLYSGEPVESAISRPPEHPSVGRTVSVALSDQDLEDISTMLDLGQSQASIARHYGLSSSRMHRIKKALKAVVRAEVYEP
jgi:hypothetical protein